MNAILGHALAIVEACMVTTAVDAVTVQHDTLHLYSLFLLYNTA